MRDRTSGAIIVPGFVTAIVIEPKALAEIPGPRTSTATGLRVVNYTTRRVNYLAL